MNVQVLAWYSIDFAELALHYAWYTWCEVHDVCSAVGLDVKVDVVRFPAAVQPPNAHTL